MSNFQIKQINDKSKWEKYAKARVEANFLQSYNWGLFQQKLDKKFFPIAVFSPDDSDEDHPLALALVIKEEAKRGDYLTIAGGPLSGLAGKSG